MSSFAQFQKHVGYDPAELALIHCVPRCGLIILRREIKAYDSLELDLHPCREQTTGPGAHGRSSSLGRRWQQLHAQAMLQQARWPLLPRPLHQGASMCDAPLPGAFSQDFLLAGSQEHSSHEAVPLRIRFLNYCVQRGDATAQVLTRQCLGSGG